MRSQGTRKKLTATSTRNLRTLLLATVFEPQAIGERLAQARNEAGLTQEDAADLVGVSTRSLQGYEAGDVVPYRHMRTLAEVYKKQIEWLLHGDPDVTGEDAVRQAVREELEPLVEALRRVEAQLEDAARSPEDDVPA
jgi:transcriptional regulator with XRE-family HTH domain